MNPTFNFLVISRLFTDKFIVQLIA